MQNLDGSVKASFHQPPNRIPWLKQENKTRARQNKGPKKAYKKAYSV